MKIKQIERKTNAIVQDEVNKRKTMMKRRIKLIGHLLRHNRFVIIIIKGKMNTIKDQRNTV